MSAEDLNPQGGPPNMPVDALPSSTYTAADLEAAVRRALDKAKSVCVLVRHHDDTTEEEAIGAMMCALEIGDIIAAPDQIAAIVRVE